MISPSRGDLQDSVQEVCRAPWIWKYKPAGQIETTCLQTMYQGRVESTLNWKEYPKWDPSPHRGGLSSSQYAQCTLVITALKYFGDSSMGTSRNQQ
jgi:hypothetical protein